MHEVHEVTSTEEKFLRAGAEDHTVNPTMESQVALPGGCQLAHIVHRQCELGVGSVSSGVRKGSVLDSIDRSNPACSGCGHVLRTHAD